MHESFLFTFFTGTLTVLFVSIYYRLKRKPSLKTPEGKPLFIDFQDDRVRILIAITNIADTAEGTEYTALGVHNSHLAGFRLALPRVGVDARGVGKNLVFKKVDDASDRFLHLLAFLFHVDIESATSFADNITADYIDLNVFAAKSAQKEPQTGQTSVWHKLFFNADSDVEYAELFLNIHHKEGYIEIT